MTTIIAIICASAALALIGITVWVWGWIAEQLENDERGGRDE